MLVTSPKTRRFLFSFHSPLESLTRLHQQTLRIKIHLNIRRTKNFPLLSNYRLLSFVVWEQPSKISFVTLVHFFFDFPLCKAYQFAALRILDPCCLPLMCERSPTQSQVPWTVENLKFYLSLGEYDLLSTLASEFHSVLFVLVLGARVEKRTDGC